MAITTFYKQRGFTLLELLLVITIIGLLSSVILFSVSQARLKGRDSSRYQQTLEFMKAIELYVVETGRYPAGGGPTPVQLSTIHSDISAYIASIPADPLYPATQGYYYCASTNRLSMAVLINTEQDKGSHGSNHCVISRGPQQYTSSVCSGGPISVDMTLTDRCADRIR